MTAYGKSVVVIVLYVSYFNRAKGNTLHEKEIDDDEVELSSSQPISSDHKLMIADTLTYPIEKLGANNDIEEFDSD